MITVNKATPYGNRFLLIEFNGEIEPRVFDTLLLQTGAFEQLRKAEFFNKVYVDKETKQIAWGDDMQFQSDEVFALTMTLTELFLSHYDVADAKNARSVVHDAYVDILGKEPSEHEVDFIIYDMDKSIKHLAAQWGWQDTEVREKVHEWITN